MNEPSLWSRLKKVRLLQVLVLYLGAAWVVIEVTDTLQGVLSLPDWTSGVAFVLLLTGLVVILATAWVQSHPMLEVREEAGEVPDSWEVGVRDFGRTLRAGRLPHLTWGRALVGGAFVFSLLFGFAGMYVLFHERGHPFGPDTLVAEERAAPGIAVVPFTVNAPELSLWREGMVDVITANLDGLGSLRGIDSRTVLARWSEAVPDGSRADLDTMLGVARSARARWALIGSLVGSSEQVRLTADIYDAASGAKLGNAQAEGAASQIMPLVDELTVGVARVLLGEAEANRVHHLSSLTTSSLPALEAYLEGESAYRRSEFEPAIAQFQRAVREDSTFALAWLRMHDAYGWVGLASEDYYESLQRASALEARLPERDRIVVRSQAAFSAGVPDELPSVRAAVQRYPDDPELWYELGEYYFHFEGQVVQSLDSALTVIERAIELDPSFAPYYIHAVGLAIWMGDSALAAELLEAQRSLSPGSRFVQAYSVVMELVFGDAEARERAWRELDTWPVGAPFSTVRDALYGVQHTAHLEEFTRWRYARRGVNGAHHVHALADQGRVRSALAFARDAGVGADETYSMIIGVRTGGLELPMAEAEAALLADTRAEPLPLLARGVLGATGRPAELRAALAAIERERTGALAAADSLEARRWAGLARALEGYAAWRGGDPLTGRTAIDGARPHVTGYLGGGHGRWHVPSAWLRIWLGDIHAELGEPRQAAAYYGAAALLPPFGRAIGLYRLGEMHEKLGEHDEARRTFEVFAEAWADADAELQPMVVEARRRVGTYPRATP